ncbi:excinuclease ABC subunit UvrB [Spirochaeta cellobiosiphila]|uniref:excinuclease ABC subunit UvrB n=1 Tax=Spirochaeta cellobiosiphila TaxID=504483 RepID=UPI000417A513|nr:excinuclease ABC subunit UvrB [Spirochaeta cellobiosiphila]
MPKFEVVSEYSPSGDQGPAIEELTKGVLEGKQYQTLRGVTGSGKTFTMANVIARAQRPTLVISHNKTLAAQLYRELKEFFPHNAVNYFVSYYDYYQPEAYVPSKDLYIEKDSSINDEIDRMRLAATANLMTREDVIIVSTVSCIYGLGNPKSYFDMRITLHVGDELDLDDFKRHLVSLQYERNNTILDRAAFRVRGDIIEVYPAYAEDAFRIDLEFDEVVNIKRFDPLTMETLENLDSCIIYPAKHFVMPEDQIHSSLEIIRQELKDQVDYFTEKNMIVEAQRIKSRTEYDLEMMEEMGYCSGIENYSRHLAGRRKGERPSVLLDYFPDNFLTIIDESHVTLGQIRAMYEGDKSRKSNLVNFGFRLPSALDNRPLFYKEFEDLTQQTIYVTATPGKEEMDKVNGHVVEQLIRPTGLLDPEVDVRPTEGQIEDLYGEIQKRIKLNERVLVTTLTKKMSEDLSDYFLGMGMKVRYLHSEIETIERVEILKDLRAGIYDCIIGINLLREGLDLPEVSLVAILDADKIGFLRSTTALIQTIGRAARNQNGHVIMYADRMSPAMDEAISETKRRRQVQIEYNEKHGITPTTIKKALHDILEREIEEDTKDTETSIDDIKDGYNILVPKQRAALVKALEKEMLEHAKNLEFEKAAKIRDEIKKLQGADN